MINSSLCNSVCGVESHYSPEHVETPLLSIWKFSMWSKISLSYISCFFCVCNIFELPHLREINLSEHISILWLNWTDHVAIWSFTRFSSVKRNANNHCRSFEIWTVIRISASIRLHYRPRAPSYRLPSVNTYQQNTVSYFSSTWL